MNHLGSEQIYFFTVATKTHSGLEKLKETAKFNGWNLDVIGMGDQRFLEWGEDLGVKLDYLFHVVINIPPKSLVLFANAHDVLVCQGPDCVLEQFLKFHHPIVFSADLFLNSDAFMGYAWAFRKMFLADMDYKDKGPDQRYCESQYFKMPDLITLDRDHKLFVCVFAQKKHDIKFQRGKGKFENQPVAFLHFNGPKGDFVPTYDKWKKST